MGSGNRSVVCLLAYAEKTDQHGNHSGSTGSGASAVRRRDKKKKFRIKTAKQKLYYFYRCNFRKKNDIFWKQGCRRQGNMLFSAQRKTWRFSGRQEEYI